MSRVAPNESARGGETADLVTRALLDGVANDVRLVARVAGIHGVLALLNARTRFRFTAIGDAGFGRSFRHVYDRENPADAMDHEPLFEELLAGSPSDVCSELRAPLVAEDGLVRGVLCHYDLRLRVAPSREDDVLRFVGEELFALLALAGVDLGSARAPTGR